MKRIDVTTLAAAVVLALAGCIGDARQEEAGSGQEPALGLPMTSGTRTGTLDAQVNLAPDGRLSAGVDGGATARDAAPGAVRDTSRDAGAPGIGAPVAPAETSPLSVGVILIEIGGQALPGRGKPKAGGRIKVIGSPKGPSIAEVTASTVDLDAPAGFAIHGNSSAGAYPMKSIEFEVRDTAGLELDAQILGLPAGSDFNLYACYADKTALRNYLAFELGRSLSRWAPRTRFVEVFVDGQYNGLYLLEERIRRDKARVPIPKPAADATGDLTGGYILKFDSAKGTGSQWTSKLRSVWNHYYPKPIEVTADQRSYIRGFIDKFEASVAGPDWLDPASGYKTLIDLPSWIDTTLMQELSSNPDAYWRSTYFYKDSDTRGGKLSLGPLWDYDLAFGNSFLRDSYKPEGLAIELQSVLVPKDGFPFSFFWKKMWTDEGFKTALRCRWNDLRRAAFSVPIINAKIDAAAAAIAAAEKRHHARWPVIGKGVPPNRFVGKSYDEEIAYLKDWIGKRTVWLDANLPGVCP